MGQAMHSINTTVLANTHSDMAIVDLDMPNSTALNFPGK